MTTSILPCVHSSTNGTNEINDLQFLENLKKKIRGDICKMFKLDIEIEY